MRTSPLAAFGAAYIAVLLAGCGGGGGSTPPISNASGTLPLYVPGSGSDNVNTTYSVWATSTSGTPTIGIAPLGSGTPSSDPTWLPVTGGGIVVYPDGSIEMVDALGNFDASQSAWAVVNAAALAANPNDNPEGWVAMPGIAPQNPLDTTVVAYAPPGGPTMVASSLRAAQGMRTTQSGSAPNELTSVSVSPRVAAVFDNDARTFTVVGTDSDGNYVSLSHATVAWTLGGCGIAAGGSGRATPFSSNPAKASYAPPASGTSSAPDALTATVANGTTYGASGSAFYFDPSQGVSVSGVLQTSAQKNVANGIVSFIGGGREFYHGNLIAVTDANGNFKRTVPPNRTLSPIGGQNLSGALGSSNGSPNIALFTVDSAYDTNVLLDPNIGSALAFHL